MILKRKGKREKRLETKRENISRQPTDLRKVIRNQKTKWETEADTVEILDPRSKHQKTGKQSRYEIESLLFECISALVYVDSFECLLNGVE